MIQFTIDLNYFVIYSLLALNFKNRNISSFHFIIHFYLNCIVIKYILQIKSSGMYDSVHGQVL